MLVDVSNEFLNWKAFQFSTFRFSVRTLSRVTFPAKFSDTVSGVPALTFSFSLLKLLFLIFNESFGHDFLALLMSLVIKSSKDFLLRFLLLLRIWGVCSVTSDCSRFSVDEFRFNSILHFGSSSKLSSKSSSGSLSTTDVTLSSQSRSKTLLGAMFSSLMPFCVFFSCSFELISPPHVSS